MVGQRVVVTNLAAMRDLRGRVGTIVEVMRFDNGRGFPYRVAFDSDPDSHWPMSAEELEPER